MNRNQIQTLLKINGFSHESVSDEEVRAVLLSARYSEEEVDAALVMLREDVHTQKPRVDGLHKVFYSDKNLHPHEITGLLGVDVDLETPISARSRRSAFSFLQFVFIWFISVVFAVSGILFYMYVNQVGFFHASAIVT